MHALCWHCQSAAIIIVGHRDIRDAFVYAKGYYIAYAITVVDNFVYGPLHLILARVLFPGACGCHGNLAINIVSDCGKSPRA